MPTFGWVGIFFEGPKISPTGLLGDLVQLGFEQGGHFRGDVRIVGG